MLKGQKKINAKIAIIYAFIMPQDNTNLVQVSEVHN